MALSRYAWIATTIIVGAAGTAAAATAYPARPVRLIVSALPATPPDALARLVGEPLAAALGKPVVVDNRSGGGGTIGMTAVAKATPDGYTVGIIGVPQLVATTLVPEVPYDPVRDFAPVTQLTWTANILVVRSSSSLRSLAEFMSVARAKPDQLTHASAGIGSPSHLASELFKRRAGIHVRHVPYKGITLALTAVLSGEVDITFAGIATALPLVQSSKLRALATAAGRRLPAVPDLPTIAELGLDGYQLTEWHGLVAPAGTPSAVVSRLAATLARIVASPETGVRLAQIGLYPAERFGPDALAATIRGETPRWSRIVREAGIRAE